MNVTSRDVARLAGVSQPTVSRVLRGDPRVLPETKQRILKATEELGYVTASVGRSLSTQTTGQVAVVADLDNPFYPFLLAWVHDELATAGLKMVLLTERTDDVLLSQHLLDRSVDGVLLTTISSGSRLPRELRRRQVPFVFLNRYIGGVSADRAVADNRGGGAAVADLLLDLGHHDIGMIMGPANTSTSKDREYGCRERLSAAGVEIAPARVVHGGFRHDDGVQGFARISRGQGPPTALFCVNDFVAVGAYNAALAAGLSIPEDVTIVGFDDVSMASWPAFELTTVNVPVAEMARAATQLLITRLRGGGPERPRHRTFATSLVPRRSHGPQRS